MAGYIKNSDGGYSVNYEDERFQEVKSEQAQKESQTNQIYDNILSNSDKNYQDQINATKEYEKTQSELQQAQTDFAIEQVEQQKEQAQKDYRKEQKGAYVDYMKQTKSNAQNMANSGLSNTGYSESSIVSMYNTYQNRVGTAKESLNQSILNYNNSIQQAILANNEKLAEIAYNSLQTQNQLNQQAFEYKNTMLLQKEQSLQQINDTYYARYQDVLAQINTEIDLQMELDRIDREYEQWLKEFNLEREQFEESRTQWKKEYELKEKETNAQIALNKAQENYYYAKIKSEQNSNNPYDDDTSKLSEKGKNALNLIKFGKTTFLGKKLVKSNDELVKKYLAQAVYTNQLSENDADIIWNKLGY